MMLWPLTLEAKTKPRPRPSFVFMFWAWILRFGLRLLGSQKLFAPRAKTVSPPLSCTRPTLLHDFDLGMCFVRVLSFSRGIGRITHIYYLRSQKLKMLFHKTTDRTKQHVDKNHNASFECDPARLDLADNVYFRPASWPDRGGGTFSSDAIGVNNGGE